MLVLFTKNKYEKNTFNNYIMLKLVININLDL